MDWQPGAELKKTSGLKRLSQAGWNRGINLSSLQLMAAVGWRGFLVKNYC